MVWNISKVNNKTPERPHWRRSGVLLLTLNIFHFVSSVSIVDYEQANVSWVYSSVYFIGQGKHYGAKIVVKKLHVSYTVK